MTSLQPALCSIRDESDLLDVRALLRHFTRASGLSLLDETKFLTAGAELARNIVKYATRGGAVRIEAVTAGERRGLRATFSDSGPGIEDVAMAMRDGHSTSGSMGIGLPGSKRLVDEFFIDSRPGTGTTVVIVYWLRN